MKINQPRNPNGRWRKAYLSDFGIKDSQIAACRMVCGSCGYGKEIAWVPVLKTGFCPKCTNQENHIKLGDTNV